MDKVCRTGLFAAGAAVLGSFLPWLTAATAFGTIEVSGTTGGDGWIAVVTGLVMAALIYKRKLNGALVLAWLGTLGAVGEMINVSSTSNEFAKVSIGYGLLLTTAGFIVALVSIIKFKRAERGLEPRPVFAPPTLGTSLEGLERVTDSVNTHT
jgi:hypothetical protein